jgi:hypothetical protein
MFSKISDHMGKRRKLALALPGALQPALSSTLRRVEADLARLAAEFETIYEAKFSNTACPAAAAPLSRGLTKISTTTESAVPHRLPAAVTGHWPISAL